MSDERARADRDDRDRSQVRPEDVGTAASASIEGRSPEGSSTDKGLSAAGGAVGGAAAGTAAGMVTLGPLGSIVGAIAGAVGGAWAGLASGRDAGADYTEAHDAEYRAHYERDPERLADRSWEDSRVAYQLGHFAAMNPDYAGRRYDEIEPDLRRGWSADVEARHGRWERATRHARAAYESRRGSVRQGTTALDMGGTESHRRASFADPIPPGDPDGVLGPPPDARSHE